MTGDKAPQIGAILLAAGGSSRLGRPKQLVEFEGKPLIRRSAEFLSSSVCKPVIVVLGAEIDGCKRKLDGLDISIRINNDWSVGISSSIKSGLKHLLDIAPQTDAALIALCDQPYVTTDDYDRLAAKFAETRSSIVASDYAGVLGVPAIFACEMFSRLLELRGDQGARDIVRHTPGETATVFLHGASIDVDTLENIDGLVFGAVGENVT